VRDLFEEIQNDEILIERIGDCAFVLRGFALPLIDQLLPALERIQTLSPFRHMITPGGFKMSVALTNCGRFGWITDRRGYRYTRVDPETCQPWPCMPDVFMTLAQSAAIEAGYPTFEPDACLINHYEPGTRLTLHQDKNERSFDYPIVSVSLGIPATFLFGGTERSDPVKKIQLLHGDVVVWGGKDRLRYHGISQLKEATHPVLGPKRINFTFRKAE
jgi:alkylated DNA repair protein (DNA oxidative demethylase)